MKKEVLRLENVTVENKGIVYLDDFSLTIVEGEIIGMIGTNHHGLDELISLICDNITLKYGRVYFNEKMVNTYLWDTKVANKVFLIDQKSRLVPDLTISDNIFVLRKGFKKYVINRKMLNQQVDQTMQELGLQIDPNLCVSQLNSFERCTVELIRAVLTGSNLILLREINEVLSSSELAAFFNMIRYYRKQGISFLYIANHHEEVFQICTRFALVEDGKIVKFLFQNEMNEQHITPFVTPIENLEKKSRTNNKPVLELRDIRTEYINGISCKIYAGECLTFLDCNNMLIQDFVTLFKAEYINYSGKILKDGKEVFTKKDFLNLSEDMIVIPENPMKNMLFSEMTYLENLSFLVDQKIHKSLMKRGIYKSIEKEYIKEIGEDLRESYIDHLSPQSLYTLIYYKVLLYNPEMVCIVQPFLGADMYLRVHIAKLINRLKQEGISVVILTVHVTDVLAVSDELYLIENGKLSQDGKIQENQSVKENYYRHRFEEKLKKNK